ncbi:hypothetical protein HDU76_002186 [Blyttiomyces sp. JEL0837]|nr:hypothetical protein HDU76_002186 [Blyttiomyces sp. JEL0837]
MMNLFHFGVEMKEVFTSEFDDGWKSHTDTLVKYQVSSTRVKLIPWMLRYLLKCCLMDLVKVQIGDNLNQSLMGLPDPVYRIRGVPETVLTDVLKRVDVDGYNETYKLIERYGLNLTNAERGQIHHDEIERYLNNTTNSPTLPPFYIPKPSMIIAQSSLWDIHNWAYRGFTNESQQLEKVYSSTYTQNLINELIVPILTTFPGVPVVIRTTPLPSGTYSRKVVAGINDVLRQVAGRFGLRVLDWEMVGGVKTDDGYHASDDDRIQFLNMVFREMELWDIAANIDTCEA